MKIALLRLTSLVAAVAACGAAVVPGHPGGDASSAADAAAASDGGSSPVRDVPQPLPPADAGGDVGPPPPPPADVPRPPPPVDVPLPPPPPPPPDAGVGAIGDLCIQACERQARDCGAAARACVPQCAEIERAPGIERCRPGVLDALRCLVREGFVCSTGGSGEVPPQCRPLFESVQRCLDNGTPTPVPEFDAGFPDV